MIPSYTGSQLRYIIENYPHKQSKVIAIFTGLSVGQIYRIAEKYNLRKTAEFLSSEKSGIFTKTRCLGHQYRFPKGHIPANKGKKMSDEIRQKVQHTFFKKGHLPGNTKHDGYISIRKDSNGRDYAHIRVSQGKFDLLHRHIWIQKFGPVPKGKIVAFKNGNTSDFENLELITREENMKRNTIHNYPPDLQQAVKALNKLSKAINEYYGKK